MKRIWVLACFLVAGITLAAFVGCDEDEEDKIIVGPLDTAKFEFVSELFGEGIIGFDESLLDIAFELIDSIGGPGGGRHFPRARSSVVDSLAIVTYEYSNFWHIFSVWARLIGEEDTDTLVFDGVDSLRFGDGTNYMQYPDITTSTLDIHCHFAADISGGPEMDINASSHANLGLTGEFEGDFTVNGSTSDTIGMHLEGPADTCEIDANMSQIFTNLLIDSLTQVGESCPPSGLIAANAGLSLECTSGGAAIDSLNIEGSWLITYAFSERNVTVTFNDGTSSWSYSGYCGPDVGGRAIWHRLADYVTENR